MFLSQDWIAIVYFQMIDVLSLQWQLATTPFHSHDHNRCTLLQAYQELYASWQKRSTVTEKKWRQSQHAQNLRYHPEEYEKMVKELLKDAKI